MASAQDKPAEKAGEKQSAEAGEMVTYLPQEGDPPSTKWRGIVFHANVPKRITDASHLAAARLNRFFKVGAFDPEVDRVPTEYEKAPKTSEQYRAHCIAWLPKMSSVDQLDTKWASEETLRMDCDVGTDDIDYLQHLIAPKRAELKKAGLPV